MYLSQKVRIEPTEQQEGVLTSLSEMCRLLYNFSLNERIENWKEQKKKPKEDRDYLTYTDQQNELPELKEKYPKYKWVYSKVLQMVLREVNDNYKSFFSLWKKGDEKANPPSYKGSQYFTTMHYNQSGFKFTNGSVEFSHNHPSGVPLKFEIPDKFNFEDKEVKQVDIFRDEMKGEYYISVTYEADTPEYEDNGLYQAFDLGLIKHTGVNMHGKFVEFYHPRPEKYWEPKIEEVQGRRDHCKKGSNRWERYNEKLQKMKRKLSNQLKDYQHKLSKKIVENTKANTIIVGDLSTKEMAKNKKGDGRKERSLHWNLHNTGRIGRFIRFLSYKAEKVGKKVIRIDEKNTTKTCCVCGKKKDRPLSERTIECDCGNDLDRDKNSAVNLMDRFLSTRRSVDEQLSFRESLLRHTGLGYPRKVTPKHSQEALSNL